MNFKKATDALFATARHDELAKELGVSVALIRQARLNPKAKAYREAPAGWQRAVIKVTESRVMDYLNLIEILCNVPTEELRAAVARKIRPHK